jgi:hypothetical protein
MGGSEVLDRDSVSRADILYSLQDLDSYLRHGLIVTGIG